MSERRYLLEKYINPKRQEGLDGDPKARLICERLSIEGAEAIVLQLNPDEPEWSDWQETEVGELRVSPLQWDHNNYARIYLDYRNAPELEVLNPRYTPTPYLGQRYDQDGRRAIPINMEGIGIKRLTDSKSLIIDIGKTLLPAVRSEEV